MFSLKLMILVLCECVFPVMNTHRSVRAGGSRRVLFVFTFFLGLIAVMTQISVACC